MKTEPKAFRPQCNIELVLYVFQLLRLFRLLITNRTGSTRSDSAKPCQRLVLEFCGFIVVFYCFIYFIIIYCGFVVLF